MRINSFVPSKDVVLEAPLEDETLLLTLDIENVDRVGFDLTTLEQEYYKVNKLELTTKTLFSKDSDKTSWNTVFQKWILDEKLNNNIYVDHSGLYGTYPFVGRAAEQLKKYTKQRPELAKLLNLRGKVGYDICIDYIEDNTVVELLHLEHDFGLEEYDLFLEQKLFVEVNLEEQDWEAFIYDLYKVLGDVRNPRNHDTKANLFGCSKAFNYYNRL
jgi:hypothetical protein